MTKENISYSNPGKAEWMEIIQASLKQTSIEDFKWNTESGVSGLVFAHAEDLRFEAKSFAGMKDGNQWKVGMAFNAASDIQPELVDGAEVLRINEGNSFDEKNVDSISAGTFIIGFENWDKFIAEQGRKLDTNPVKQKGSSIFCVSLEEQPFASDFNSILYFIEKGADSFQLELKINSKGNNSVDSVAALFSNLVNMLDGSNASLEKMNILFDHLVLSYTVSANLLFEIAMIRAIKLVCYNLQKSLGLVVSQLKINAIIDFKKLALNPNDSLIKTTVAALGAAVGGVNSIFVDSFDRSDVAQSAFLIRLTRNIQMILKEESFMNVVNDPAAGSYAIEDLTVQLANKIWNRLGDLQQ